jgi:hypothetical protein
MTWLTNDRASHQKPHSGNFTGLGRKQSVRKQASRVVGGSQRDLLECLMTRANQMIRGTRVTIRRAAKLPFIRCKYVHDSWMRWGADTLKAVVSGTRKVKITVWRRKNPARQKRYSARRAMEWSRMPLGKMCFPRCSNRPRSQHSSM